MDIHRATRSDAKSEVRKAKAPPARRFKSAQRRSQERLRTCPGLRGLNRIETVIENETGEKGGIGIPPHRPRTGDAAEIAAFPCRCQPRGRTGKGTSACSRIDQFAAGSIELAAQDADEVPAQRTFALSPQLR
jgi:hypothetical protein